MTIDEEMDVLSDNLRRLKVEYEVFFNGGAKKPPVDLHSRVEFALKKYGDSQKLTSHQRFRYNTLSAKFAVFCDLWRKRMREREEGISVRVRRKEPLEVSSSAISSNRNEEALFEEVIIRPMDDRDKVVRLYQALKTCKEKHHDASKTPPLGTFEQFVLRKTHQLVEKAQCESVAFRVVWTGDRVRFEAVPVGKRED